MNGQWKNAKCMLYVARHQLKHMAGYLCQMACAHTAGHCMLT